MMPDDPSALLWLRSADQSGWHIGAMSWSSEWGIPSAQMRLRASCDQSLEQPVGRRTGSVPYPICGDCLAIARADPYRGPLSASSIPETTELRAVPFSADELAMWVVRQRSDHFDTLHRHTTQGLTL